MSGKGILSSILIPLAVGLAIAFLGLCIGVRVTDWPMYRGLDRRGVQTRGRVVAKEPHNHRSIRYSYVVGGLTYSGSGHSQGGNPSFEQLEEGDPLVVFYDADSPGISCLGYPGDHLRSATAGVIFLTLVPTLFALVSLYKKGYLKSRPAI